MNDTIQCPGCGAEFTPKVDIMTEDTREYLCGLLKDESERRQSADEVLTKRLDRIDESQTEMKKAMDGVQAKLLGTKGMVLLVIAALSSGAPELVKLIKAITAAFG
jgi:hypothetical protein